MSKLNDTFFFDNGGNYYGYSNNFSGEITFNPATEGQGIVMNFELFSLSLPDDMAADSFYDYSGSGDPTTATWTALSATWSPTGSTTYTPSGNISLTSYSGQTVYIAFHYRSSGNTSGNYSAWKIDDFKIEK